MKTKIINLYLITLVSAIALSSTAIAEPVKPGDKAPDFALKTLDHKSVRLRDLTASNNVVLLVLRGWPGYQCPLCTKQVHEFVTNADDFAKAKVRVLMVYPGPAQDLQAHAREFLNNKNWPKDFLFVTDPDYTMVTAYGLRWDAHGETAYPSTFILDGKRTIRFLKISHTHGDRSKVSDVLEALKKVAASQP